VPGTTIDVTDTVDDVETQDSTISCNTIAPDGPPNVSVAANVQNAQGVQAANNATAQIPGQGFVETQAWMVQQFSTNGPEDYKQQGSYADFGNFNYGAVCGGLGYSSTYCQSAAGVALIGRTVALDANNFGTSVVNSLTYDAPFYNGAPGPVNYDGSGTPFVSAPYGDQPGDSGMIAQGYAYQAQGCD
jgi:hypothetical protein